MQENSAHDLAQHQTCQAQALSLLHRTAVCDGGAYPLVEETAPAVILAETLAACDWLLRHRRLVPAGDLPWSQGLALCHRLEESGVVPARSMLSLAPCCAFMMELPASRP